MFFNERKNDEEFIKLKTYLTCLGNEKVFLFAKHKTDIRLVSCDAQESLNFACQRDLSFNYSDYNQLNHISDKRFYRKCKHKAMSKVQNKSENKCINHSENVRFSLSLNYLEISALLKIQCKVVTFRMKNRDKCFYCRIFY